jgi:hydrogenase nickel incorporation protein HypA/HybF
MHEIAITSALMTVVSQELDRCGGGRVTEIAMSVGGLQSAEPQTIKSCFELLSEGTPLEGADLTIERLPIIIHCNECNSDGPSTGNFRCGKCNKANINIISSGKMTVNRITVSR